MPSARKRLLWIVGAVGGVIAGALAIRHIGDQRFRRACNEIEVGSLLADARARLERAGGRYAGRLPDRDEHQWIRVRLSMKHQNCAVTVDAGERVVSVRYSEVWDLL